MLSDHVHKTIKVTIDEVTPTGISHAFEGKECRLCIKVPVIIIVIINTMKTVMYEISFVGVHFCTCFNHIYIMIKISCVNAVTL